MNSFKIWSISAITIVVLVVSGSLGLWLYLGHDGSSPEKESIGPSGDDIINTSEEAGNLVLGRPTGSSITANILAAKGLEAFIHYGTVSGDLDLSTGHFTSDDGAPIEITIGGLAPNTEYYYALSMKGPDQTEFVKGPVHSFMTARAEGSTFSFAVQGDSHPERVNRMFDPDLYRITMENVAREDPDLYFTLGDDFSIEGLIEKDTVDRQSVSEVYLEQREYLSTIGCETPLFLVNGNHEQAAKYLLDGTDSNPAILAGNARNTYFPLPAPDDFYTGDETSIEHLGLPRDYYAWTWGDALFVVLDFYWHSPGPVDNVAGGREKETDMWNVTLGKEQYDWFRETLSGSDSKHKFVFCHHVLGTGRGGIEEADNYEWGGYDRSGKWEFDTKRPGWEAPIHQLMAENGVTIFFFGHDHLFAKQEKDGLIYQSVPNPADPTYTAFNEDAYESGDKMANSGHLLVTVSSENVKVEYVRSWLPKDEGKDQVNGEVAYSYTTKGE